MRLSILLLLIIALSGCVGISRVTSLEKKKNTNLWTERGVLSHGEGKKYSKAEVISLWGEADKKVIKKNSEHWIYNREVAWRGIIVWAILPIPLTLPLGYRKTTLIYENNVTVRALSDQSGLPTLACTPLNFLLDKGLCTIYD